MKFNRIFFVFGEQDKGEFRAELKQPQIVKHSFKGLSADLSPV